MSPLSRLSKLLTQISPDGSTTLLPSLNNSKLYQPVKPPLLLKKKTLMSIYSVLMTKKLMKLLKN
jgi:hypothetical protein